jgi:hypothetical protein
MEKTPLPDIELEPGEVTYVSIRSKVEAADDALTQEILSAQALSEHTDPVAVAHAMRDARCRARGSGRGQAGDGRGPAARVRDASGSRLTHRAAGLRSVARFTAIQAVRVYS